MKSNWFMIDKRLRRSRANHDKEMASGPIKYTKRPKKKAWCNIIQWHGQLVGQYKSSLPAPCVVALSLSLPCLFISDTKNSSHVDELMGCGAHGKWHHKCLPCHGGNINRWELLQVTSEALTWSAMGRGVSLLFRICHLGFLCVSLDAWERDGGDIICVGGKRAWHMEAFWRAHEWLWIFKGEPTRDVM